MAILDTAVASSEAVSVRVRGRTRWIPLLVGAACLTVFTFLQLHLERAASTSIVGPTGTARVQIDPVGLRYRIAGDLARFIGLSIASVVLVLKGRRRSFVLPAIAYFAAPLILGYQDVCQTFSRNPAPIGYGWNWGQAPGCTGARLPDWGAALLDLALVLAPVIVFAVGGTKRMALVEASSSSMARAGELPIAYKIAGGTFAAFGLWALTWAWITGATIPSPWHTEPTTVLPLVVFGFLVASLRPNWFFSIILVTLLLGADELQTSLPGRGWNQFIPSLKTTWPLLAIPVIAAIWRPIARVLRTLEGKELLALGALNVLNVADSVLTRYAINTEQAAETNPVVRAIGLPAKIVGVGLLSVVLYRLRPRFLPWVVLAFGAVLVWHFAGFAASPR